jgi:hypothetical protein
MILGLHIKIFIQLELTKCNNMDLNKLVTIVIPCKNEKDIILKTLDLLNYQVDINNVKEKSQNVKFLGDLRNYLTTGL